MKFIHLSHLAKPYIRAFWKGDVSVTARWQIILPVVSGPRVIAVVWTKPPRNWIKINTNGSYCQRFNMAASGGVFRDEDGRILLGFQSFIGHASVIYSELLGIWQGLNISKIRRMDNVIIESDSKLAI